MLKITKIEITTDEELTAYLTFLVKNNLHYHPDDHPTDIVWNQELTDEQIDALQSNHDAMWEFTDLWKWFDMPQNNEIWELWKS